MVLPRGLLPYPFACGPACAFPFLDAVAAASDFCFASHWVFDPVHQAATALLFCVADVAARASLHITVVHKLDNKEEFICRRGRTQRIIYHGYDAELPRTFRLCRVCLEWAIMWWVLCRFHLNVEHQRCLLCRGLVVGARWRVGEEAGRSFCLCLASFKLHIVVGLYSHSFSPLSLVSFSYINGNMNLLKTYETRYYRNKRIPIIRRPSSPLYTNTNKIIIKRRDAFPYICFVCWVRNTYFV